MKITNHHELRRDISIDCSEPKITDQSFKNACDINVIMANYAKTGMLPSFNQVPARYVDNSEVPSLETSFDVVNRAIEAFYTLPPDIRKLMDNDPAKLENFLSNSENEALLLKHGVIIERQEPQKSEIQELTEEIRKANLQAVKTTAS